MAFNRGKIFRTAGIVPFVLMLAVSCGAFITLQQYPAYDIKVTASADPASDQAALNAIVHDAGLDAMSAHPDLGKTATMPCVGRMHVLAMYRMNDATGVYIGRLDDGSFSVTEIDTGKLGAPFTTADRTLFSTMAQKLTDKFGVERVTVPKVWGDGIVHCDNAPAHPLSDLGG